MASEWVKHVKSYRAAHPGISYSAAMIAAKGSYVKPPKQPNRGKGPVDFLQNIAAGFTERPGDPPKNRLYPGEIHALIWNASLNRYEPAQWMGPGTNVETRTLLNQRGLAPVDRMSKAHDLRYSIGKTKGDIKLADDIFFNKIDELRRTNRDVPWNLNQASLLRVKDYLPFIGSSSGGEGLDPVLKARYDAQLRELERDGYGILGSRTTLQALGAKGRGAKGRGAQGRGILGSPTTLQALGTQGSGVEFNTLSGAGRRKAPVRPLRPAGQKASGKGRTR